MALSAVPFIPKDGVINVQDATGTPISLDIPYEDGDGQFGPFRQSNMSVQHFKDRGVFYASRTVEEEAIDFSFSCHLTELADSTEKAVADAFLGTGAWSSGVSTLGASAEVWAVTVTWTGDTSGAGGDVSTIVLTYCVAEVSFSEGVPGTLSISGQGILSGSTGIART